MKKTLGLAISFLVISIPFQAWAEYDSSHIPDPQIIMTPTSGSPGTKITITISDLPDISKEPFPYPNLYIYLPFVDAVGNNVPGGCNGESCFAVYTFEDAQNKRFESRTVVFTLFGLNNPKSTYLNGKIYSVCDIKLNERIQQSFGETCHTKTIPPGNYEVKLAWGTLSPTEERYNIIKTMNFTVTEDKTESVAVMKPRDLAVQQYKDGVITESEFDARLNALGYSFTDIRQLKALIGKISYADKTETSLGSQIPLWIRSNAAWWVEGKITDDDFTAGIDFFIEKNIIRISEERKTNAELPRHVPWWVKNNAKWWSEGQITDRDFVLGIEHMVTNKIIIV
ncbi:MAG TPA: hypothetical protein VLB45_06835 [Nitrosopumilaceae archaeon]|nr:hypothetical protein [Nitrosopumilaceae archaeon]